MLLWETIFCFRLVAPLINPGQGTAVSHYMMAYLPGWWKPADIILKGDWNRLQVKGGNQLINFYTNGWRGMRQLQRPLKLTIIGITWQGCWWNLYSAIVTASLLKWKRWLESRNPKGETGTADYSNALIWNIGRNEAVLDRVFFMDT